MSEPNELSSGKESERQGKTIAKLEEELARVQESLAYALSHDFLTGFRNRAGILDVLRREMARFRREHTPFAVIVFGVDQLKEINEKEGVTAGDAVLRAVAQKIISATRPYDSVGRYSANQFLIAAPGCSEPDAIAMAERIRLTFTKEKIEFNEGLTGPTYGIPTENKLISVTLSLGVFSSVNLKDAQALLRAAEEAFYRAKDGGGNRVRLGSQASP